MAVSSSSWLACGEYCPRFRSSATIANPYAQGDGCRQHLRCHRSFVLRWFLDLGCHHPHSWWIRDRVDPRHEAIPQLFRALLDGEWPTLPSPPRGQPTNCSQGWFIFTFLLLLCTLRSTVAFFSLFFTLDLAFLCLGIGYLENSSGGPNGNLIKAGGVFGILAAFLAWYNALAGIADPSNSFFIIPVAHFPWVGPFPSPSPSRSIITNVLSSPRRVVKCAARSTTASLARSKAVLSMPTAPSRRRWRARAQSQNTCLEREACRTDMVGRNGCIGYPRVEFRNEPVLIPRMRESHVIPPPLRSYPQHNVKYNAEPSVMVCCEASLSSSSCPHSYSPSRRRLWTIFPSLCDCRHGPPHEIH